jgi:PAS domain S-box-containing protein
METLLVEDDALVRFTLETQLRSLGHEVTACEDARTALEAYQQTFYPLIVLDLGLPGMDGLELCRRIRSLPYGDRSMILIITAWDRSDDLQAALDAGADDYLVKPIGLNQLQVRLTIIERQFQNLTQRKQAEEALQESEERFRRLAESAFEGILIHEGGVALVVNDQFCEMVRYEPDELLGKQVIPLTVAPEAREFMRNQIATGGLGPYESIGLRKDGTRFPMEIRVREMESEGRKVRVATVMDITEHKRAEEALRESEEKYRSLVEAAPDVVYTISAEDGSLTSLNPAFEALTGWSRAEWLGKPFIGIVHPDDQSVAVETFQEASRGETPPPYELRVLSKSGEYLVGEFTSTPYVKGGKVVGELGIARDITERKRAEELLELERRRLSMLLETFPGYIYLQSPDHTVRYTNPYFVEHFGEPKGRLCYEVLWGRKEPCEVCPTFEVFDTKTPQVWEWSQTPDGRIYVIYDYPFIDSDGSELVLEIGVDITERKRAEERLKAALQEKEVLLREIHHRVKNNMQAITSMLHLLRRQLDNDQATAILQEGEHRIHTMAIIHEMLYQTDDFVHIAFQQYATRIVRGLLIAYGVRSDHIGVAIEIEDLLLELDLAIPCGLLINELVSNSLKHAFPGGQTGTITVSLQRGQETFALRVSDTGVGLPAGLDLNHPTTLGFTLIRSWVNQLLGEITLERPGLGGAEGTPGVCFRITFPTHLYQPSGGTT